MIGVIALLTTLGATSAGATDGPPVPPAFCHATTPGEIAALTGFRLSCRFGRATMRYAGSPVIQARCLLRVIPNGGVLPTKIRPLPRSLEARLEAPMTVTRAALRRYLAAKAIAEADIGGSLDTPLARTAEGHPATYFVIHDTSTPNYGPAAFPPEIDSPDWAYNALDGWKLGQNSVAHLFIARSGASVSPLDYATPWRATKTESCVLGETSRGLFLHNELVQPRRADPDRPPGNDGLAPTSPFKPFTDVQLDRLALAYVAASVRAGHWMIPATHAAIDEGMEDAHDDPREFPIADWAARSSGWWWK